MWFFKIRFGVHLILDQVRRISPYSNFMLWEASSQIMAFIFNRSTTPWKLSSAPIGTTIGTGLAFKHLHLVHDLEEVGTGAIHLVRKGQARHLVLVDWRHTVSDWGCTPPTAQYTITAPSSTCMERSTSMVKSTWPGVSKTAMSSSHSVCSESVWVARYCLRPLNSILLHVRTVLPKVGGQRGFQRLQHYILEKSLLQSVVKICITSIKDELSIYAKWIYKQKFCICKK